MKFTNSYKSNEIKKRRIAYDAEQSYERPTSVARFFDLFIALAAFNFDINFSIQSFICASQRDELQRNLKSVSWKTTWMGISRVFVTDENGWIFNCNRKILLAASYLFLVVVANVWLNDWHKTENAANELSFCAYSRLNWGEFPQLNIVKF